MSDAAAVDSRCQMYGKCHRSVATAGAAEVDAFAGTEAPVLSAAEVAALDSDEDDDDEDEGALPPGLLAMQARPHRALPPSSLLQSS